MSSRSITDADRDGGRKLARLRQYIAHWVQEMHVDGSRFDLGTILAREPYGFDEDGGFLDSCRQDPVLSSVKLIAEAWDCGIYFLDGARVRGTGASVVSPRELFEAAVSDFFTIRYGHDGR